MQVIKFHELEDGAQFMFAQTWTYGSRTVWQKTLEDGGNHNCVLMQDTNKATFANHSTLVIPVH
ncbi:hypothetical protein WID10_28200 [Klebsiella variicola]|uniref:hypothetical protein n=1 Tax=Klebsiella variicola TaxID=244366 RepID=UPI00339CDDB6